MDLDVAGRTYLVTGGSRGLGLATAHALAAEGATVGLVAREAGRLRAASESLGTAHPWLAADLAAADAGEAIGAWLDAESIRLDGVLANVGGPPAGRLLDLSDREWGEAIDGVLLATVRLLRAVVPRMSDGGSILLVLSQTAKEPIASLGASNALRPGLGMAVKDLADQLAPRLRVNGILPGRIATDRLMSLATEHASLADGIPLGRPGEPAEFGRVAAFLLSPAASYITGTLIPVDGGLLRSPW